MAKGHVTSYSELVHQVLIASEQPMTFQEVFDAVNRRRAVDTRNPKTTIRQVLTQAKQLMSIGDGRWGYLPRLMKGSLLRLQFTHEHPADHPLVYPEELFHAICPSFYEGQMRRDWRPVTMRMANGEEAASNLEHFGGGRWGTSPPEGLRQYLIESRARLGDSLVIRVADAEERQYEARLEPFEERDDAAIAQRNQQLADATYQLLHSWPTVDVQIWAFVPALLARGSFVADVAPDSLVEVLATDSRFVDAGASSWMLGERMGRREKDLVRQRAWLNQNRAAIDSMLEDEPNESIDEDFESLLFSPQMEEMIQDLGAMLGAQGITTEEQAADLFEQLLASEEFAEHDISTPLDEAQDLIFEAWETESKRKRVRLARQALEISPDCADAYVILAEDTARHPSQAADLYRQGVAAGERALGPDVFEKSAGHFWGMLETRPYMRARFGLAESLWALGQGSEAVQHLSDMLRLNPQDNQGIRYVLLNWLLETDDDAQARRLAGSIPAGRRGNLALRPRASRFP